MRLSATRIRAISRKELREYRHNRQLIVTMSVLPLIFIITPAIQIFAQPAASAGALAHQQILIYMLAIPAIVPATFASISVAGERQQGTLEPVLTTPIRREEFLLGKALAAAAPAIVVSYGVFGVFVAAIEGG
jgi:ABC-type Na+ efflux pump permease subunit